MSLEKKVSCGHKTCKCSCEPTQSVRHEGLLYCSQRCAEDRGCDHEQCNCGASSARQPEL